MADIKKLESLRWDLRQDCVDIIKKAGFDHVCFSPSAFFCR